MLYCPVRAEKTEIKIEWLSGVNPDFASESLFLSPTGRKIRR